MRSKISLQRDLGFTLVELVISIVLVGMVAAVGTSMLKDTFATAQMVNDNTASVGQARYVLERLAREIRETKYANSTATPATYCSGTITDQYCITAFSATNLVLSRSDGVTVTICNGTNSTTCTGGSSLFLGYSSPATTSTLTSQVGSFTLTYYDVNGYNDNSPSPNTTPITASNMRFVVITLTVTDPTTGVQSTAQRTRVSLRNA